MTKTKKRRAPKKRPRQTLAADMRLGDMISRRLHRFANALAETTIVVRREFRSEAITHLTWVTETGGELASSSRDLQVPLERAVCDFLTKLHPTQIVQITDCVRMHGTVVVYYRRAPSVPLPHEEPT